MLLLTRKLLSQILVLQKLKLLLGNRAVRAVSVFQGCDYHSIHVITREVMFRFRFVLGEDKKDCLNHSLGLVCVLQKFFTFIERSNMHQIIEVRIALR